MVSVDLRSKRISLFIVIVLAGFVSIFGLVLFWVQQVQDDTLGTPVQKAKPLAQPLIRPSLVATGLQMPTAIVATHDRIDRRLFVPELGGTIQIVTSLGEIEPLPFLDIRQKVLAEGEMGLLGLVFHADYAKNGFFYVNYIDKDQNTVLARYTVSKNADQADPVSEKVLLRVKQPYTNHNGGDLAFGPDGYLYIALGDGGSAGDPGNLAQDKTSYFGKILRIDVDYGDPYAVPASNPFVGQPIIKPEIWAYGLRNPWRISFDTVTGDLFMADVGQGKFEEINFQPAASKGGENYGWRCLEGDQQPYNSSGCPTTATYTAPIIAYNHDEDRCSVTGGYVYRGSKFPALRGKYLYADYCSGQLYAATKADQKWQPTLAAKTAYKISAFGQDSQNELYFADYATGSLYQLRDVAN